MKLFFFTQCDNFEMDQAGMKTQLSQIHKLMQFVDPELCSYLGRFCLDFIVSVNRH